MRDEMHWKWMIKGLSGKMVRTRHTCSEAEIKRLHPEAVKIEGTGVVRQIAETEADLASRMNHGRRFQEGTGHGLKD